MTRRKQNAPKRLKSTDKPGTPAANEQSVDSSQLTSDSGEEEDEEEGDTTSDEESIEAKTDDRSSVKEEEEGKSETVDKIRDDTRVKIQTKCKENRSQSETDCQVGEKEAKNVKTRSSQGKVTLGSSHSEEGTSSHWKPASRLPAPSQGNISSKYKYSSKLSPPLISPSAGVGLANLDPQMALVMSSMPLALLSRGKNSTSPLDPGMNYFPGSALERAEEQPLDLSRKPVKSSSSSIERSSRIRNSSGSSAAPGSNGFSSLQSLQQRFGGDYPLELSQKAGAAVIPLQPSMPHKSAVAPHALPMQADARSSASKPKSGSRSDWLEKQEAMGSRSFESSPMIKGENSRQTSPMLADEPNSEMGGKHTIHRCSCQKSFNTLYALSVHLQETGHAPGSSKAASLMDYPKLVRGQDMWLNQESEQTRRILRCMQCGESFKSLPLLTVHMMQTQHYTKIVSSDHGRRSHKCSTYCDRELDKECIFKCKVCHEAFTDMEGLANHMIVSGHHKKQSSRQIPNPAAFAEISSGISSMARQGRRKRFFPEDISQAVVRGGSPTTVASLLEYKRKNTAGGSGGINGYHSDSKSNNGEDGSKSPDLRPIRLVLCDSCGKKVDAQDFDLHVRACLRQRAEVIDALKNKLAAEEAILSRSESKLLRSGFSLSSVSGIGEDLLPRSDYRRKESLISGRECKGGVEKQDQSCKEYPTKFKSESVSLDRQMSFGKQSQKCVETSAKICDLIEVPLTKWYCNSEGQQSNKNNENKSLEEERNSIAMKTNAVASEMVEYDVQKRIKKEEVDSDTAHDSRSIPSPSVGKKRKLSVTDSALEVANGLRDKSQKLSPNLVTDTEEESLDFTYSALHKLDMFSRGLQFSPPRRKVSPEPKLPPHSAAKVVKRKESSASNNTNSKKEMMAKSPASLSPSPLSQIKTESQDPTKNEVTFDIIDPDAVSEKSSSSALEAMESFINKSFSAKSEIRSSNLASMFSPFGSCFPLPGSLPGQSGVPPDVADPTMSYFAKFSKFFRMVPGVPPFPGRTPAHYKDSKYGGGAESPPPSSESYYGTTHEKPSSLGTISSAKPLTSSTTIRVPSLKFPSDTSSTVSTSGSCENSGMKRSPESTPSSKKYKYSTINSCDALQANAKNHKLKRISSHVIDHSSAQSSLTDHSKEENLLPSSSDLEKLKEELKRKRQIDYKTEPEEDDQKQNSKCSKTVEAEDAEENVSVENEEEIIKIKEEKPSDDEDGSCDIQCNDNHLSSGGSSPKSHDSTQSPENGGSEIHSKSSVKVPKDNDMKLDRAEDFSPNNIDSKSKNARNVDTEDSIKSQPNHETCESSVTEDKSNDASENEDKGENDSQNAATESKGEGGQSESPSEPADAPGKSTHQTNGHLSHSDNSSCDNEILNKKENSFYEFVDDDSEDCKSPQKILPFSEDGELVSAEKVRSKIHTISSVKSDKDTNITFSKSKEISTEKVDIDESGSCGYEAKNDSGKKTVFAPERYSDEKYETSNEDHEDEDKEDSLDSRLTPEVQSKLAVRIDENVPRPISPGTESPVKISTSSCDANNVGSPTTSISQGDDEENSCSPHPKDEEKLEKKMKKKSALDSLSSFVYSQPLTSEHPLDSLQRLLSTNDLTHLPVDLPKNSAISPYKCLTPDLSTPLNLTTKSGAVGVGNGGCSSDDNEEGDMGLTEGGASEGEVSEYKCAACNRRFASKGSYRYHLSRCHLSSVKKFGIKEAFNMSPYVYLPLDHTAKFSKYYQMAHELANKGK